jgi:hypothetical protein
MVNKKLPQNMFPYFCVVDIIIRWFVIFVIFFLNQNRKKTYFIWKMQLLKKVMKLTAVYCL